MGREGMSVLNPKFNIIESYKDIEYREFDAYEMQQDWHCLCENSRILMIYGIV